MSQYSDFFGVASSGGGGESLPINSYNSFFVSTLLGNPTGWDTGSGLYSHPNGEFWLRTGFQIEDAVNNDYPNAYFEQYNVVDTPRIDPNPFGSPQPFALDPTTNEVYGVSYSRQGFGWPAYVTLYDANDFSTEISGTTTINGVIQQQRNGYQGFGGLSMLQFQGGDSFIWSDQQGGGANQANNKTFIIPSDYSSSTQIGGFYADKLMYSHFSEDELLVLDNAPVNSTTFEGYNSAGQTTGNNLPDGFEPDTYDTIGGFYWKVEEGSDAELWQQYDTSSYEVTGEFMGYGNVSDSFPRGQFYNTGSKYFVGHSQVGVTFMTESAVSKVVGDKTARTDPDTSKPFFIRIK